MSDQSTTTTTAYDREPQVELVPAQVLAAGVSYFTKEAVIGPDGEPTRLPNGETLYVTLRHEALQGELIELMPLEYARLKADGFVRDPSSEPILPIRMPTPFSVPLAVGENGELMAYPGPVMGDPRPSNPDESGREMDRRPLTAEESAALEARANGQNEDGSFNVNEATSDEVKEHIEAEGLTVPDTLALAKQSDGTYNAELANKVLTAELDRDDPRSSVVDPLEKVVGE